MSASSRGITASSVTLVRYVTEVHRATLSRKIKDCSLIRLVVDWNNKERLTILSLCC